MEMCSYFVVNLESVSIQKAHPYTLVFKGYIPTYGGNNKLYTFKYDGGIAHTDSIMPEDIKQDFAEQLCDDYGCGILFDLGTVRSQLKKKSQYRMKM